MLELSKQNPEIENLLGSKDVLRKILAGVAPSSAQPLAVQVSYLNRMIRPTEELRDALDRDLGTKLAGDAGTPSSGERVLLLLDPDPTANWGHPCWIAAYDVQSGQVRTASHNFPPFEDDKSRLV